MAPVVIYNISGSSGLGVCSTVWFHLAYALLNDLLYIKVQCNCVTDLSNLFRQLTASNVQLSLSLSRLNIVIVCLGNRLSIPRSALQVSDPCRMSIM